MNFEEEKEKQTFYLKPCPFCGEEPLINTYQDSDDPKTYIECKICKIEGKKFNQFCWSKERGIWSEWELAKKQAIEFWNTRNNEKEKMSFEEEREKIRLARIELEKEKLELEEESTVILVKRDDLMKEFNENLLQMKDAFKILEKFSESFNENENEL